MKNLIFSFYLCLITTLTLNGCSKDSSSKSDYDPKKFNGAIDKSTTEAITLVENRWCLQVVAQNNHNETNYVAYSFYENGALRISVGKRTGEELEAVYHSPQQTVKARWSLKDTHLAMANENGGQAGEIELSQELGPTTILFSEDGKHWETWFPCDP